MCQKFHVNIAALGVGEAAEDLNFMDPMVFAESLVGLKN
jgi:signal recognition particle GTPase